MNKLILAIALALSACTTDDADPGCGPAPMAPFIVAAFDTVNGYQRATMTIENYNAIVTYQRASQDWATCMENR